MNRITITLSFVLCGITTSAYSIELTKLDREQRTEYLINLAKKVTQEFGPEWYEQGPTTAIVADTLTTFQHYNNPPREKITRNIGRKYYSVTLYYDNETKKKTRYSYASQVYIWADDGEPMEIIFGNSMGRNFIFLSYSEWTKMGIRKEDQTKYVKIDPMILY